ncbi:MAG: Tll0287-like domain-containing protein [Thermodesulfobacteriota bacterium]
MGIRARVILMLGICSLLVTLVIGLASYLLTERMALVEAKNKGRLLLNSLAAHRSYFMAKQRPLVDALVEENRFYPELMSGFFVARGIWDIFARDNRGYHYKQATLDPRYPPNKADPDEVKMIEAFRRDSALLQLQGLVEKEGKRFYYLARPIRIDEQNCLQCHGDPADAPRDQIEIYGTERGYGWQLNETVSASVIYVSMEEELTQAQRMAGVVFLVGMACFFLVLLVVVFFLDRHVIQPVEYLGRRVEEISQGKNMQESFRPDSDDEIAVLARAIDHLRRVMAGKKR